MCVIYVHIPGYKAILCVCIAMYVLIDMSDYCLHPFH